ncbi:hypothetical protein [Amnibacterium kyonggiense]|uniref:Dolichyl-phosphate-mannose-protein mannosyltransferase n=1 Tax=Amnibacterium kyonggiense TaxID=595671 RepID=A0A4R7FPZ1_9MICO|nr:hypothetical protein [Amnibacterium kyonggiense]TDS79718.1 hypothetical protein CLV52_0258 [Amnibacterium kyonggiense]
MSRPPRPRTAESRFRFSAALIGIGVLAYAVRLSIMLRGGGLHGLGGYDDGVYYAAADALVHGRIPYRDFLLIQPPLIVVVTAPFAALGGLISDPAGFALARLVFIGVGAMNAVLTGWILRRFGRVAVLVGGVGYAVFYPAVYAERSVLLEPLGTLGILVALLLLQRASTQPQLAILAGIAAGLGVGAKIWYIVLSLLLLATAARLRLRYLVGLAVGGCGIYLPFLLLAPQRMLQDVVLDQLGRPSANSADTGRRIQEILGAHSTLGVAPDVIAPVLGVLAIASIIAALLTPGARTFGVLAIGALAVLLLAPSWFPHYSALTAPPLMLCAGVGAARAAASLPHGRPRWVLAALLVIGILGANEANDRHPVGVRTPAGVSTAAAVVRGCVTADDPGALIEMNVLSRDLRDTSCAVWPDVTGWTYDPRDYLGGKRDEVARRLNPRWQHDVMAFLESGDATIRLRRATGLSTDSKRAIDSGAILFRDHRFVVHTTHG